MGAASESVSVLPQFPNLAKQGHPGTQTETLHNKLRGKTGNTTHANVWRQLCFLRCLIHKELSVFKRP